jgi:ribonucleotide reductase beta subunit family protein with ferritin-like domain
VTDIHLHDPQTLYRHWEAQQWSPFAVDLERDREQWPRMSGDDRGLVHWALSSLMVAEERITTKFAGLVLAHGSEEEATFLATQQVDEARHMQFYARFQDEVIADPAAIAAHVARAREKLSPAFATVFDEALVQAHERLVASPGDPAAKVAFVTTYHLVIESTLGLTAFRFITRYLEREGLLPGFVEGYGRIHHDEQRHIGYGGLVPARGGPRRPGAGRRGARHARRAAAGGGRVAHAAGPRGHRLGRARRERSGGPRVRPRRAQPPPGHHRRPAQLSQPVSSSSAPGTT